MPTKFSETSTALANEKTIPLTNRVIESRHGQIICTLAYHGACFGTQTSTDHVVDAAFYQLEQRSFSMDKVERSKGFTCAHFAVCANGRHGECRAERDQRGEGYDDE